MPYYDKFKNAVLEQAREGSDPCPIEIWQQDESEPHLFILSGTGERLSRAEIDGRRAQVILVMYGGEGE